MDEQEGEGDNWVTINISTNDFKNIPTTTNQQDQADEILDANHLVDNFSSKIKTSSDFSMKGSTKDSFKSFGPS